MTQATHMTGTGNRPAKAELMVSLRGARVRIHRTFPLCDQRQRGNRMNTNILEFPKLRRAIARASVTTGRAAIVALEEHRAESRIYRKLAGVSLVAPASNDGGFLPAA